MKKIIYTLLGTTCILTSCEDFLSEVPTKGSNQPITELSQLEALLENTSTFVYETSNIASMVTDDYEISKELFLAKPAQFKPANMQFYIYNEEEVAKESADGLWSGEYKKIYNANLILNNLKNVEGSPEEKKQLQAEAHFVRAYSYWVLANNYCLPYHEKNFSEMGLPKKLRNDYDEDLTRISLKQLYDFIDSDLAQAALIDNRNIDKRWRLNKAAYHAFMSRYRLFRGEYELAITEADEALKEEKVALIDFATLKPSIKPGIYTNPNDTIPYSETNDYAAYKYVNWNEFYYTRFLNYRSQWLIPSKDLLSKYDTDNDYRFINFMMPNSNRRFSILGAKAYRYTIFDDGRYAISGPSISEVLLNKAEAATRLNANLEEAKTALYTLQSKRIKGITRSEANDHTSLLKEILEERRRELPFSMRFYDIRRYSVNETADDDIVVTRDFFEVTPTLVNSEKPVTYVLPVASRKYAFPINQIEIMNSRNQIQQNKY